MNKKYYKQLSRSIIYEKFMYLCTNKEKHRTLYNFYLRRMKAYLAFHIENFKDNRHLNMKEL